MKFCIEDKNAVPAWRRNSAYIEMKGKMYIFGGRLRGDGVSNGNNDTIFSDFWTLDIYKLIDSFNSVVIDGNSFLL